MPAVSRRSVLAAAAAVPFVAASNANAAVPPTVLTPLNILTIGDSLTNGYGDSQVDNPDVTRSGYRRELSNRLTGASVPHRMANAARNGGTTADLLPWVNSEVARVQPDLTILAIGTNDAVQSDASVTAFEGNYAQLLVDILNGKPDGKILAVFCGYPQPAWMKPRIKLINDAIYRQAMPGVGPHGTRICGVADWQMLADYALFDGVHPRDAGYDVMGCLAAKPILTWLGVT